MSKTVSLLAALLWWCFATLSPLAAYPALVKGTSFPIVNSVDIRLGLYAESSADLSLPHKKGTFALLRHFAPKGAERGVASWQFNLPGLFTAKTEEEIEEEIYSYEYDQKGRLVTVALKDEEDGSQSRLLQITYIEGEQQQQRCLIESCLGDLLTYSYSLIEKNGAFLPIIQKVEGAASQTYYGYDYYGQETIPALVKVKKIEAGEISSSLSFDYQLPHRDATSGDLQPYARIQSVSTHDTFDQPALLARFVYQRGQTEVTFAEGALFSYFFSSDNLLKGLDSSLPSPTGPELYKREKFVWDRSAFGPQLILHAIADKEDKIHFYTCYSYDASGHMAERALYSAAADSPEELTLAKSPELKGKELWSYSKEGVLTEWTDLSSRRWQYVYDSSFTFLESKKCFAPTLQQEHSFKYDANSRLMETTISGGNSSEKRRAVITYSSLAPELPLAETITEGVWDTDGNYTDLSKMVNSWDSSGKLAAQSHYINEKNDSSTVFDGNGRPIELRDKEGSKILLAYSENGKIASKSYFDAHGNESKKESSLYDAFGRLETFTYVDKNNFTQKISYSYDMRGRCIAKEDAYGNKTLYEYDPLGRLVKIVYPAILDADDVQFAPQEAFEYDIFGNITAHTDKNGWITRYSYNFLGKPVAIEYPDGTSEKYSYTAAGLCEKKWNKDGTFTTYSYDGMGNLIEERLFSGENELLSSSSHSYNSWQKSSTTDSKGNIIHFSPDGNVAFSSAASTLAFNTDLEKESIHVKQRTAADSSFLFTVQKEGLACQDSLGGLLQQLDLLGASSEGKGEYPTTTSCCYNDRGQIVPSYSSTDSEGVATKIIVDAMQRVEELIQYDCWGRIIKHLLWRYDGEGNKLLEKHFLHTDKKLSYSVKWQWGPNRRLEGVIEGDSSNFTRATFYQYNGFGLLEKLINPNGAAIFYSYDSAARLAACISSDGSINYSYRYDAQGNCIEAKDAVTNQSVVRSYNLQGQLLYEKQMEGQQLFYSYDEWGRRSEIKLPDNSYVRYEYKELQLFKICRYDAENRLLYSHCYAERGLSGHVKKALLPKECGEIDYEYDLQGLFYSTSSPYWQETIFDEGTLLGKKKVRVEGRDSAGSYLFDYQLAAKKGLEVTSNEHFHFDSLGNRFSDREETLYDPLQQLAAYGPHTFAYDLNGNTTEISDGSETKRLSYDALGHMTEAAASGLGSCCYRYDPFGRRYASYHLDGDGKALEKKLFVYDGSWELGEWDKEKGSFNILRILGEELYDEVGAAIAIEKEGKLFLPIHDRQGNLRCLVDAETKSAVQSFRYSSYGIMTLYDGEGNKLSGEEAISPWGWSSKRLDKETGFNCFNQRYYFPLIGRWLTVDPLGLVDGVNRYVYSHNNPFEYIDPSGTTALSTFAGWLAAPFKYIAKQLSRLYYCVLNAIGDRAFGDQYLDLEGGLSNKPISGAYGGKEANPLVRISSINGLFNTHAHAIDGLELISNLHGGVNIHYVFRHTKGAFKDLFCGLLVKLGYVSPYARELASKWKELIAEMGGVNGGGIIYHYAHSMGGSDTYAAQSLMTEEELKMIHVVTFGSPTLIPQGTFGNVINCVSLRDVVCWMDPLGYLKGLFRKDDTVFYAGNWWSGPTFDHWMTMETYKQILTALGQQFIELYLEREQSCL